MAGNGPLPQPFSHDVSKVTVIGHAVAFPGTPYSVQQDVMESVLQAVSTGKHALLESPTGCGKTRALLSALLAWLAPLKQEQVSRGRQGAHCRLHLRVEVQAAWHIAPVMSAITRAQLAIQMSCHVALSASVSSSSKPVPCRNPAARWSQAYLHSFTACAFLMTWHTSCMACANRVFDWSHTRHLTGLAMQV